MLPLSNFPVQVAVNALAICISIAEFVVQFKLQISIQMQR